MLDTGETSVKGALQRARAALRKRLPDADRERAPRPDSAGERRLVGRFADAVESGDVDEMVALLTDDARLTMPPLPLEYQGHDAIGAFLRHREELRGRPLRVVPTRANTQPAFGCYLPDTQTGDRARPRAVRADSRRRCGSPPSPGSATRASSHTSGCRARCGIRYKFPSARPSASRDKQKRLLCPCSEPHSDTIPTLRILEERFWGDDFWEAGQLGPGSCHSGQVAESRRRLVARVRTRTAARFPTQVSMRRFL